MTFEQELQQATVKAFLDLYQGEVDENAIQIQKTRKEFEGDVTINVFPFLRISKGKPEETATQLGEYLKENFAPVKAFSVVKGFLNLSLSEEIWLSSVADAAQNADYGKSKVSHASSMVEYSSPNTNKPLHLGHLRNNFLGYSVAEILKANGYPIVKTQIINDRGIHICKSMVAWQKFGHGETPETSGLKGDKLVGKYYVEFDKAYKAEIAELVEKGTEKEAAEKEAPIFLEAQEMLRQWEAGDEAVVELWKTMNGWVYAGFNDTYIQMGVDFDSLYYESETFLLGKAVVEEGLAKGVFFKKEDGSVWIDLTDEGLDQKLLLRSDGTAVYMTQDIGTAIQRFKDVPDLNQIIYTVGNEQNYHFKVLFIILDKLGYTWAKNCYHLSYGMVELPEGKMKSREGTVVDADDLMDSMINTAFEESKDHGVFDELTSEDQQELANTLGMGALKYFLLKVDPKKNMMFNPKESIDMSGNTAPFIQYTHARIKSILRKAEGKFDLTTLPSEILEKERELMKIIHEYPAVIAEAGKQYSPALIANYVYELTKAYNSFYQAVPIFKEENQDKINFRIGLSAATAQVIQSGMKLLGIRVPERM